MKGAGAAAKYHNALASGVIHHRVLRTGRWRQALAARTSTTEKRSGPGAIGRSTYALPSAAHSRLTGVAGGGERR